MDKNIRQQDYIVQSIGLLSEVKELLLSLRHMNDGNVDLYAECISGGSGIAGSMYLELEMEMEVYVDESLERLRVIEDSLLNMMHENNTHENLKIISNYAQDIAGCSNKVLEIMSQMKIELRLGN